MPDSKSLVGRLVLTTRKYDFSSAAAERYTLGCSKPSIAAWRTPETTPTTRFQLFGFSGVQYTQICLSSGLVPGHMRAATTSFTMAALFDAFISSSRNQR